MDRVSKVCVVVLLTIFVVGSTARLFWEQERGYARPAPVPLGWQAPPIAASLALPPPLAGPDPRPHLLHFYDPGCPCSRFNLVHLAGLTRRYAKKVRATVVVADKESVAETIRQLAQRRIPLSVIADTSGAVSRATGVYAAPQAVLVDARGRLYFRGNYNSSRFCRDQRTEFARLAIEALLAGRPLPPFPAEAARAYGCSRRVARGPETVSIRETDPGPEVVSNQSDRQRERFTE